MIDVNVKFTLLDLIWQATLTVFQCELNISYSIRIEITCQNYETFQALSMYNPTLTQPVKWF